MISKMLRAKEAWQVEGMLEEIAREMGTQIRSEVSSDDPDTIPIALNRFGFESHVEDGTGRQVFDRFQELSPIQSGFKASEVNMSLIPRSNSSLRTSRCPSRIKFVHGNGRKSVQA